MTISVIIPVWNRAHLLMRAVTSVLTQTIAVDEIIIIDDGSDDNTAAVLHNIQNHPNIKIYSIPHCGMVGKVRNVGIAQAKGEWIAFLDSDDEWLPQKLERQCRLLARSEYFWCHTREIWNRNGKTINQKTRTHTRQGDVFKDALVKCIIGPSTALLHKRLFTECGLFREDLEVAEDYELWLRICNRHKIMYIDEAMVIKHAGHGNQLSEKYGYIENFRISALKALLKVGYFTYNNTMLATEELQRKEKIWQDGRKKRKNTYTSNAQHHE